MSGDLLFPQLNEGGLYVPDQKVEVWWNDDTLPPGARLATPNGPPMQLASQDVTSTCSYSMTFTVPNLPPGTYPLSVRAYGGDGWS